MLAALLPLLMLRQDAPISLTASYYSLKDVAAKLSASGILTKASDECAGDVYAIRIEKATWPQLKEALEADERLTVTQTGDAWRIERAYKAKAADAQALRKYLASAASQIFGFYNAAIVQCLELARLPQAEKDAKGMAYGSSKKTGLAAEVDRMSYLFYENDIPFALMAFPAFFTDPQRAPVFSRALVGNLYDSASLFVPSGSLRDLRLGGVNMAEFSDAQLAEFGRPFELVGKLVLDPISLTAICRTSGYRTDPFLMLSFEAGRISPDQLKLKITPSSVWDAQTIAAQKARTSSGTEFAAEAELPGRPLRISERLLRSADLTKTNLVCYVSTFADFPLAPAKRSSITGTIADANALKIDTEFMLECVRERTGEDWNEGAPDPALKGFACLSLSHKGGIAVARNELRFLDGLTAPGATLPVSFENSRFAERLIGIDELATHVAGLKPQLWPSSLFSSNYLQYCNPISFHPFAKAILRSPKLRDKLRALDEGKPSAFDPEELEASVQELLVSEIGEMADLNDAHATGNGNSATGRIVRDRKLTGMRIRIERRGDTYTFALQGQNGAAWQTWVRNVDCSMAK